MPALVRLYVQSVALGFGIAAAFTGGLLWFLDVAGLGHLVGVGHRLGRSGDAGRLHPDVQLAVQFAFRIMGMVDDRPQQWCRGAREPVLVPVPGTSPVA